MKELSRLLSAQAILRMRGRCVNRNVAIDEGDMISGPLAVPFDLRTEIGNGGDQAIDLALAVVEMRRNSYSTFAETEDKSS